MLIYKITNTVNGKIYIGKTECCSAEQRFKQHCATARRNPEMIFHRAIAKYGKDAFAVEVIATAETSDQLCELERRYIAELHSLEPNGYNCRPGGDGAVSGIRLQHRDFSAEHRNALRISSHNRLKTHCIRGHAFDESNTYIASNGQRVCRKCHVLSAIRSRKKAVR